MAKSAVSGIWIIGLVLIAAGIVAGVIGGLLGASVSSSQDAQTFFSAMARTTGGVILIAALMALVIGGLIQFVAWILALVATATIARWGWFVALLILGLVGLEFFVMLAYVIWGPSERRQAQAFTTA